MPTTRTLAARKALRTRRLRAAGKKAARTKKRRAAAKKAIATMKARPGFLNRIAKRAAKTRKLRAAGRKAAQTRKRRAAARKAVATKRLDAAASVPFQSAVEGTSATEVPAADQPISGEAQPSGVPPQAGIDSI